jgi:hypothetical protein
MVGYSELIAQVPVNTETVHLGTMSHFSGNATNQASESEFVNTSAFVGTDPTKCPQLPSDPSSDRNCGFDVAESLVKC